MKKRNSIKLIIPLMFLNSCGLIDLNNLGSNVEITETKDVITEDLKYTSNSLEKIFEHSKQKISYDGNDRLTILRAIKISPFLVKTKSEVLYFLKLLVTGHTSTVTNELFFKCNGTNYMAHKLSKEEIEGINSQFHIIQAGKYKSYEYQDDIIETKISKDLFNYIVSCNSDLILRAKGNKSSIDSSITHRDPDYLDFKNGLDALREKAEILTKIPAR